MILVNATKSSSLEGLRFFLAMWVFSHIYCLGIATAPVRPPPARQVSMGYSKPWRRLPNRNPLYIQPLLDSSCYPVMLLELASTRNL
jgi:hypothetical protein